MKLFISVLFLFLGQAQAQPEAQMQTWSQGIIKNVEALLKEATADKEVIGGKSDLGDNCYIKLSNNSDGTFSINIEEYSVYKRSAAITLAGSASLIMEGAIKPNYQVIIGGRHRLAFDIGYRNKKPVLERLSIQENVQFQNLRNRKVKGMPALDFTADVDLSCKII